MGDEVDGEYLSKLLQENFTEGSTLSYNDLSKFIQEQNQKLSETFSVQQGMKTFTLSPGPYELGHVAKKKVAKKAEVKDLDIIPTVPYVQLGFHESNSKHLYTALKGLVSHNFNGVYLNGSGQPKTFEGYELINVDPTGAEFTDGDIDQILPWDRIRALYMTE